MSETVTTCRSCGAELRGTWCHDCGQGHRHVRLSARELLGEAVEELASLDTRLLRTMRTLTRDPARVCRDVLAGRRVPWMHPFKYALLMATFAFLVQRGLLALVRLPSAGAAARAVEVAQAYGQLLNFAAVPVFALLLRVAFPRSGLRWIEHVVVTLYGFGHLFFLQACLMPLQRLEGAAGASVTIASALLPVPYFAWIAVGTWGGGWLGTILRLALAWAVLQAAVGVLLAALWVLLP